MPFSASFYFSCNIPVLKTCCSHFRLVVNLNGYLRSAAYLLMCIDTFTRQRINIVKQIKQRQRLPNSLEGGKVDPLCFEILYMWVMYLLTCKYLLSSSYPKFHAENLTQICLAPLFRKFCLCFHHMNIKILKCKPSVELYILIVIVEGLLNFSPTVTA